MIRRSRSFMMILAIAGCSAPQKHAPNTDTVALLRTLVKFASDTLKVGPRIIIARSTKANPEARLSLPTQQALLADSMLSTVERYDLAHQTCDSVAKAPASCHFQNADGMIAVRDVRMWRDSARVGFEYYRANAGGPDAKTNGNTGLLFYVGDASLDRDVEGHWKIRHYSEAGGGAKP